MRLERHTINSLCTLPTEEEILTKEIKKKKKKEREKRKEKEKEKKRKRKRGLQCIIRDWNSSQTGPQVT